MLVAENPLAPSPKIAANASVKSPVEIPFEVGKTGEYEVMLTDGTVKLGQIKEHPPRLLLAQGSASSDATWERFSEIIRQKEMEDR